MLLASSKRARSSTTAVTCLPFFDRVHQRADDARVAAGAVERLLDGQHVRIGGGLLQEIAPRCRSSRTDGAAGCPARGWRRRGRPAGAAARPPARRTAGRAARANDRLRTAPSAAWDSAGRRSGRDRPRSGGSVLSSASRMSGGQSAVNLQPHGVALAAVVQFVLDRLEQVGRFLLVDVELAVARDAEQPVAENASCRGTGRPGNARSAGPERRNPAARRRAAA